MQHAVLGELNQPLPAPDSVEAVLTLRSLASVQRDEPPDVLNLPHALTELDHFRHISRYMWNMKSLRKSQEQAFITLLSPDSQM